MSLTPYKNLTTVTPNTGRIDDALLPASEIEFKFDYELDFDAGELDPSAAYFLQTVGASFEARDAGGGLLLAWSFSVEYTVSYQVIDGGLAFWSWYADRQAVTITAPAPAPATLGDPNGIAEPGGGSDYSDGTGIIQQTFESPIFKVPLPAGTTVKVTHHTASFPSFLNDIAQLQVRTQKGGGWVSGFRHAVDGEAVLFYAGAKHAAQARASGRGRTLGTPDALDWGADSPGFLLRSPGRTTQTALYGKGGDALQRLSLNAGASYGDAMVIYAKHTWAGVVAGGGLTTALLLDAAGAAYLGLRDRSGKWADPVPVTLPAGVKLTPGVLLGGGLAALDFFFTDAAGDAQHVQSVNGGKTWT